MRNTRQSGGPEAANYAAARHWFEFKKGRAIARAALDGSGTNGALDFLAEELTGEIEPHRAAYRLRAALT